MREIEREFEEACKRARMDPLKELLKAPEFKEARPKESEWEEFLSGKMAEMAQTIEQLKEEIEVRRGLRDYFVGEIDQEMLYARSSLKEFTHFGLGYNVGVDVKRNFLEKQLTELRKERRRMQQQCFDDLIDLRKQLREALAEYKELLRRRRLLEGESHGD